MKKTSKFQSVWNYIRWMKNNIGKILLIVIILLVANFIYLIGSGKLFTKKTTYSNTTTKLGFDNIGELATQSATLTEVHVTENWREFFGGVKIPFTQSKYIFSYNYEIKAGYDFNTIKPTINDNLKTITITLPEAKILSNTPVKGSFKVYHDEESAFNNITLTEDFKALDGIQNQAEKDAVANGLLTKAKDNAKKLLTSYIKNFDKYKTYTIKFENK